jgi:3-hydroxyisobutyrate dehydrogenase-like beta-hydroxyacid dehydrogenase
MNQPNNERNPMAGEDAATVSDGEPIALCGLGNMGAAVAARLTRRWHVLGSDLDPQRRAEAAQKYGVDVVDDVSHLAQARIVVLSLPTPDASASVVRSLLPKLAPGSLIIETSTVNPGDMWRLRDLCAPHAVDVIDGAILSGVAQMADGRATLLVGGAPRALELAAPVLDQLGSRVVSFGDVGSGMAAKVINNAVAHAVMVVLVEAGAMAQATGVAGAELVRLLRDPEAGLLRPLTHRFAERVLQADYAGGMPTEAARKDSTLALALAQTSGVPLFAIQAAHSVYEIALAQGLGRLDYASIAQLWEGWTGRSLCSPADAAPGTDTITPNGNPA